MKILDFIRKVFQTVSPPKEPMPPKDPMEWKQTSSSSAWWSDQYCPQCLGTTTHNERMVDVCNNCGYQGRLIGLFRANRQIWDGEKWVIQRKYGNGPQDFVIEQRR